MFNYSAAWNRSLSDFIFLDNPLKCFMILWPHLYSNSCPVCPWNWNNKPDTTRASTVAIRHFYVDWLQGSLHCDHCLELILARWNDGPFWRPTNQRPEGVTKCELFLNVVTKMAAVLELDAAIQTVVATLANTIIIEAGARMCAILHRGRRHCCLTATCVGPAASLAYHVDMLHVRPHLLQRGWALYRLPISNGQNNLHGWGGSAETSVSDSRCHSHPLSTQSHDRGIITIIHTLVNSPTILSGSH